MSDVYLKPSGELAEAKIIKSSGNGPFDRSALAAYSVFYKDTSMHHV